MPFKIVWKIDPTEGFETEEDAEQYLASYELGQEHFTAKIDEYSIEKDEDLL